MIPTESSGVSPNWCRGVSESGASGASSGHLAEETAQSFVRHTTRDSVTGNVTRFLRVVAYLASVRDSSTPS